MKGWDYIKFIRLHLKDVANVYCIYYIPYYEKLNMEP